MISAGADLTGRPSATEAPAGDGLSPRAGQSGARSAAVLTWGAVLLAPIVAFLGLRVRPMFTTDAVDPNIYTGYSQNGADLMERFGPGVYYWVRLGAILPERVSYLTFGSIAGFYALRWLLVVLIVVPLFGLLSQIYGRPAAWLGVTVFLTSPVMWLALGSDYPDAVIFAYLVGAFGLLSLASSKAVLRAAAAVFVGVLLAGSLHSQVVCAPIVGALLVGFVAATLRRRGVGATVSTLLLIACGAVAVTAVFMVVARLWLGHADLFTPTLVNYQALQQPEQVAIWHSAWWGWAQYVPYIVVPGVVALGWCFTVALTKSHGRPVGEAELAAGCWLLVSATLYYLMQFVGKVATLEYRLYSSSLWAPTLVVLAFLLVRMVGAGDRTRRPTWAVTIILVVLALVAGVVVVPEIPDGLVGTGVISAALVAACVMAVAHRTALRIVAAGVLCLGLTALTLAPVFKPRQPDVSVLPLGAYNQILGQSDVHVDVAAYKAAVEMPGLVGPSTAPGQVPSLWASETSPYQITNAMAAMYVWRLMPKGIPIGAGVNDFARAVRSARPTPMVVVATSGEEMQQMLKVLSDGGIGARVRASALLDGDGATLHVVVVDVT